MDDEDQKPYAWAKLNAYGFVLAGLGLLSMADLLQPAGTDLARLAGEIPQGQPWWTLGYVLAGLLLMVGFLRVDRVAETAGLFVLTGALFAQTVTSIYLLGITDFTLTRVFLSVMFAALTWARGSVLWSPEGLAVTIPTRNVRRKR